MSGRFFQRMDSTPTQHVIYFVERPFITNDSRFLSLLLGDFVEIFHKSQDNKLAYGVNISTGKCGFIQLDVFFQSISIPVRIYEKKQREILLMGKNIVKGLFILENIKNYCMLYDNVSTVDQKSDSKNISQLLEDVHHTIQNIRTNGNAASMDNHDLNKEEMLLVAISNLEKNLSFMNDSTTDSLFSGADSFGFTPIHQWFADIYSDKFTEIYYEIANRVPNLDRPDECNTSNIKYLLNVNYYDIMMRLLNELKNGNDESKQKFIKCLCFSFSTSSCALIRNFIDYLIFLYLDKPTEYLARLLLVTTFYFPNDVLFPNFNSDYYELLTNNNVFLLVKFMESEYFSPKELFYTLNTVLLETKNTIIELIRFCCTRQPEERRFLYNSGFIPNGDFFVKYFDLARRAHTLDSTSMDTFIYYLYYHFNEITMIFLTLLNIQEALDKNNPLTLCNPKILYLIIPCFMLYCFKNGVNGYLEESYSNLSKLIRKLQSPELGLNIDHDEILRVIIQLLYECDNYNVDIIHLLNTEDSEQHKILEYFIMENLSKDSNLNDNEDEITDKMFEVIQIFKKKNDYHTVNILLKYFCKIQKLLENYTEAGYCCIHQLKNAIVYFACIKKEDIMNNYSMFSYLCGYIDDNTLRNILKEKLIAKTDLFDDIPDEIIDVSLNTIRNAHIEPNNYFLSNPEVYQAGCDFLVGLIINNLKNNMCKSADSKTKLWVSIDGLNKANRSGSGKDFTNTYFLQIILKEALSLLDNYKCSVFSLYYLQKFHLFFLKVFGTNAITIKLQKTIGLDFSEEVFTTIQTSFSYFLVSFYNGGNEEVQYLYSRSNFTRVNDIIESLKRQYEKKGYLVVTNRADYNKHKEKKKSCIYPTNILVSDWDPSRFGGDIPIREHLCRDKTPTIGQHEYYLKQNNNVNKFRRSIKIDIDRPEFRNLSIIKDQHYKSDIFFPNIIHRCKTKLIAETDMTPLSKAISDIYVKCDDLAVELNSLTRMAQFRKKFSKSKHEYRVSAFIMFVKGIIEANVNGGFETYYQMFTREFFTYFRNEINRIDEFVEATDEFFRTIYLSVMFLESNLSSVDDGIKPIIYSFRPSYLYLKCFIDRNSRSLIEIGEQAKTNA